MTAPDAEPRFALAELLRSADFARAFTLTVLGAVLGGFLLERLTSRATHVTVIAALCVVAVAILIARRREISPVRLVPTTLLLLMVWALASTAWSTDPVLSAGRWASMAAVAVLAVTIGHVRDTLQTVRALGDVSRVLLASSLGLEILSGILLDTPLTFLGIQGNLASLGPIQGVFGTRNMLGFVALLALVTFVVEYRAHSVRPGLSVASITLATAMALLSASPTVIVLLTAVGLAALALGIVRGAEPVHRGRVQLLLGLLAVGGLTAAYALRGRLIAALGAADDLSLRTDLWSLAEYYIRIRPVQGWGWFGPWAPLEQPFRTMNWILSESHSTALNAYVDVVLQLGWAGLAVFAAFLGLALMRSWLDAGERRSIVYAWTPLILVTIGTVSVFESFALSGTGWLLLVICAVRAGQSRSWRERLGSFLPDPEPGLQRTPG